MFTGLIQAVGSIASRQVQNGDLRLRIAVGVSAMPDIQLGESIAVSGVCLTVVEFNHESFAADVSNETLSLTTLGNLDVGASVNLERSVLPTTRLGGHLVSGHVDGLGRVEKIWDDARSHASFAPCATMSLGMTALFLSNATGNGLWRFASTKIGLPLRM